MRHLSTFLTDHRVLAWCFIVLFAVPPGLGFYGFRVAKPVRQQWATESDRQALEEVHSSFTSGFSGFPSVLVIECDDFFQVDRIAAIREVVEQIKSVHPAAWIGSVPQVTLFGSSPLLPVEVTQDELTELADVIATHPLIRGQLLSPDRKTMLIGLGVWTEPEYSKTTQLAQERLTPLGMQVRLTGPAPLFHSHDNAFEQDHMRILLTAAGLIVALAMIIFRRLSAITLACSGAGFGVASTLGVLELLGQTRNELSEIILPIMVLVVGFTDGVHIVVHLRQQRVAGLDQRQAAASAVRHVGLACLLTSITTAIGFGSLMIAESEIIKGFGFSSAIGVLITFVSVNLLIPLLSCTWIGRNVHHGIERDLVGRQIQRTSGLIDLVVNHARIVVVGGVVVTGLLAVATLSLRPDDQLGHRIPHNTQAYQAMRHCDATFGGVRFIRVMIEFPEEADRSEIYEVIAQVQRMLDAEELIGSSLSIRNWLAILPGADVPRKLGLASFIPEEYRGQFWQPKINLAQVLARMQDLGMATYGPMFDRLEAAIAEVESQHTGFRLELTGESIVEGRVVARVTRELFYSLLVASVVIFVVLTLAFRSIRLGLISIIPNVFPLVMTGALRAAIDTSLDISSACAFAICLGIAVDDTIHFLIRYQHERQLGNDVPSSIRQTFLTVGSALVMTTIVMIAGFGSVMMSQLPTHYLFAAMASTTIGAALLGDLIILPALLVCFPDRTTSDEPPAEDSR